MKHIEPQDGASGLAAHPHRLSLRGSPASAAFPPLCPHCGDAASRSIDYAKVFRRTETDGPTRYIVVPISVPFCEPCIARHEAQQQKPSLIARLATSFATMDMLGAVFPAIAALFVLKLALVDALHGRGMRGLVELAIAAVFALIAWAQARAVWQMTERFRVPPQSDVTLAFDFSDDTAPAFEPTRCICAMRDGDFANAFKALNADREWRADSPRAQAEQRRSNRLLWIFGVAVVVIAAWNVLHDLLR